MYTSIEFRTARKALLAWSDADRAFLRRWLLKWTDEHGQVVREAIAGLPGAGCLGSGMLMSLGSSRSFGRPADVLSAYRLAYKKRARTAPPGTSTISGGQAMSGM